MALPVRRREVWAWALYDFANSAFATSILAVVFAKYFAARIVPPGGVRAFGTALSGAAVWNFTVALSMVLVCLSAPFVGAVTDYTARKKRTLLFYWLAGCSATAGLVFAGPGMVLLGACLFIAANVGFAGGNALYNAFLIELAPPEKRGWVSGLGWGIGYVGGGLCLAVNLLMIRWWGEAAVRPGFFVVGAWWFLFGLPLVVWLRERAEPRFPPPGRSLLRAGFSDVASTLRNLRRHRELFKFWVAFVLFNEGVQTVIINAAVYGDQVVGMKTDELISVYLGVQAVGLVGALLLGWVAGRIGSKRALLGSLAVWLGVLVFAFFTSTRLSFWILGGFVGLVMGGTQAISRGFFAELTPPAKTAEFFGFYAIGGKFAAALGPLVFGLLVQLTGGMRWGILSTAVFFVAGGAVLLLVDEDAGRKETVTSSGPSAAGADRGAGGDA